MGKKRRFAPLYGLARLLNVPTFVIFRCFFQNSGVSAETGGNTGKQGRATTSAGTPVFSS